MDKSTLSNYGWLIIVTLILAVMLALATPFGTYVGDAVVSVANGYVGTSNKAMDKDNISNLEQQWADKLGSVSSEPETVVAGATFNKKTTDGCNCFENNVRHTCWINIEPVALTWDELKIAENGAKYGYNASVINDTSIGVFAFNYCESLTNITIPDSVTSIDYIAFGWCESLTNITIPNGIISISDNLFYYCKSLTNITIPNGITSVGDFAFYFCESLTNITFNGTKAQWNAITFGDEWNELCPEITVTCSDGTIPL